MTARQFVERSGVGVGEFRLAKGLGEEGQGEEEKREKERGNERGRINGGKRINGTKERMVTEMGQMCERVFGGNLKGTNMGV